MNSPHQIKRLLDLHKIREKKALEEYSRALNEKAVIDKSLNDLGNYRNEYITMLNGVSGDVRSIEYLNQIKRFIESVEMTIIRQTDVLAKHEMNVKHMLDQLRRVRRDKELIEKLYKKILERRSYEWSRNEQKMFDEIAGRMSRKG